MKERLITLGLAVCALALFWILLFPKPRGSFTLPRPLTTGADAEGYLAAARWLRAAGVPTADLHQRFDHLTDARLAPQASGNLLVMTLPFDLVLHPEEYTELERWVARGNTVLVLAALDDTPQWSQSADDFLPQLQKITAIHFASRQKPSRNPLTKGSAASSAVVTRAGSAIELHAAGGHFGLLAGVTHLATLTPLPSIQWLATAMDTEPVLQLARRTDNADAVLWLKSAGEGQFIVSAYASLFNNQVIGRADNAQLLSNIVGWSLQGRGRVIFDDAHQGAVDEYDPAKFFADARLHHTLEWLLLLWLAWVLAAQPLRAAAANATGIDEGAMLRTTAGFLASVLRPASTAQWLLDEFFDRLRRRHGLAHGVEPPWDWLAAHAGVQGGVLAQLRALHARVRGGRRVSLMQLQRIISQISGQTS